LLGGPCASYGDHSVSTQITNAAGPLLREFSLICRFPPATFTSHLTPQLDFF